MAERRKRTTKQEKSGFALGLSIVALF